MSFRFKSSQRHLNAAEISALRKLCDLSAAEIRRRAAAELALFDIPVFSGDWPRSMPRLISLLDAIEEGALPLRASLLEETSGSVAEEALTVAQARERVRYFRDIALEQDRHRQLEAGHLSSPDEYVPPPWSEA